MLHNIALNFGVILVIVASAHGLIFLRAVNPNDFSSFIKMFKVWMRSSILWTAAAIVLLFANLVK